MRSANLKIEVLESITGGRSHRNVATKRVELSADDVLDLKILLNDLEPPPGHSVSREGARKIAVVQKILHPIIALTNCAYKP